MKKTLLIAAAALAAGVITSQAQVYSQNVVGYVNIPLVNGYNMINLPVGAGTNVESAMPSIQNGDSALIWNGAGYTVRNYIGPDWDGNGHAWADPEENGVVSPVVTNGQAIFFVNGQGSTKTNTFVGNVSTNNTVTLVNGYNMIASTPPIASAVDGTNFSLPFQNGDSVLIWNGAGYTVRNYIGPNWDGNGNSFADPEENGVPSPVISVGQGFFFVNGQGSSKSWAQNFTIQ